MKKYYTVQIREVHVSHRVVEAANEKEAIILASHSGEEIFLEYSHTLADENQDYQLRELSQDEVNNFIKEKINEDI